LGSFRRFSSLDYASSDSNLGGLGFVSSFHISV